MTPKVSFIVPCFKLAHFLKECVDSILAQTFDDFEVLILDDCSPDATPEVAASFEDPRVRYIRNEVNLGHLRNYNRGIELSSGPCIWLISPDDTLRAAYVLERFVGVLSRHASVGYVFCPSIRSDDSGRAVAHNAHGHLDRIIPGHIFLRTLLQGNRVSAPAVLARRERYERLGGFPLDLPFTADWYMWCLFAMDSDVGYLAEPMVTYRIHDSNLTRTFLADPPEMMRNELEVRWRIRRRAQAMGARRIAGAALAHLAADYAMRVSRFAGSGWRYGLSVEDVEPALVDAHASDRERAFVLATVYERLGDHHYNQGDLKAARYCYQLEGRMRPWRLRPRLKSALLRLGEPGIRLRTALSRLRHVGARGAHSRPEDALPFDQPPESNAVSARSMR